MYPPRKRGRTDVSASTAGAQVWLINVVHGHLSARRGYARKIASTYMVRTTCKTILRRAGWKASRIADWPRLLGHLSPTTVLDVGAAYGTPELYASFPRAYQVLIDPLKEYGPRLDEAVLSKYPGEFVNTAVGSRVTDLEMHVDHEMLTMSSFQDRTSFTIRGVATEPRRVPVTTLDRLLQERAWEPPFFLKIDSEGYELEVVNGAAALLAETSAVLAETSVLPRFRGGYTLDQFVTAMTDHGFVATNVLEVPTDRRGRVPWLNLLFERHPPGG